MTWNSEFRATEKYEIMLKLSISIHLIQDRVIWSQFVENLQPRQTNGLEVLVRFIVFAIG